MSRFKKDPQLGQMIDENQETRSKSLAFSMVAAMPSKPGYSERNRGSRRKGRVSRCPSPSVLAWSFVEYPVAVAIHLHLALTAPWALLQELGEDKALVGALPVQELPQHAQCSRQVDQKSPTRVSGELEQHLSISNGDRCHETSARRSCKHRALRVLS
jgi:hypothetical protein